MTTLRGESTKQPLTSETYIAVFLKLFCFVKNDNLSRVMITKNTADYA